MHHAGLLAHSADGAALCFLEFCHAGGDFHPDITLDCIGMGHSMAAWNRGDHAAVRANLARSVERLARAGAEFFFCADNTAHIALELPGPPLVLPGINIAEVVADEAARLGGRKVGILGTRFTMEGPVYPRALSARGIAFEVPEADDREAVDRIIFEELVAGVLKPASRDRYLAVIEHLKRAGCGTVALVCTEIPLLVTPEISPLPTLDSTRLLARAAFETASGTRPLPEWRGGPVGGG